MGGKETMKRNLLGWGSGFDTGDSYFTPKIPVLTSRFFCCTLSLFFLHVYEHFTLFLYREGGS